MSDKEKVRLLIGDTAAPQHYTDTQIQAFLDLADGSIFLAAALALEAWAAVLTGSAESERIGDYSYSKKEADNKLKLAERYRKNEAETPIFDWAEFDFNATGAPYLEV